KAFGDRIRWEAHSNQGACAARNRGLALTRTEYVLFLDADDYVEGALCSGFCKVLSQACDFDIIYGPALMEFENGARRPVIVPKLSEPREMALSWVSGNYVPIGSVLWRRSFIVGLGGWNVQQARNQDGELMLRALTRFPRIAHSTEGCSVYFRHNAPQ